MFKYLTLAAREVNGVRGQGPGEEKWEKGHNFQLKKSTQAQKGHGSKIMKSRTSHASAAAGKSLSLKVGFGSVTIMLWISD